MKANERVLEQILHSGDQYVIPLFQRYYKWTKDNWDRLWSDIYELLEEGGKRRHFLGSVVCVADNHQPGMVPRYMVIDGQQRIVTLSILLSALRDAAKSAGQSDLAAEIEDNFLLHRHKKKLERYKVVPRQRDRQSYLDLLDRKPVSEKTNITEAYRFFAGKLTDVGKNGRLEDLFKLVSNGVMLVVITLDAGENPFAIFKSLNSTGQKLTEADLIRNQVFMQVELVDQDSFEEDHWHPIEQAFEKTDTAGAIDITEFFRDYLMRDGRYVREDATFVAFEAEMETLRWAPADLCAELLTFARHYNVVRGREKATAPEIEAALTKLRQLNVSTTYPLVLTLLRRHQLGQLTVGDVVRCLEALSGFILRRFICNESSRGYSRWFPAACKELGNAPLSNLVTFLKGKGWPDDGRFATAMLHYALYTSKYNRAVLESLEMSIQRSEPVNLGNCTIEHVMPQTINDDLDGHEWKAALGSDWKRVHDMWLHTIGNLTLVGYDYNILMKNKPYPVKKCELVGKSKVYLNEHFESVDEWDETQISERGGQLASRLVPIWAGPDSFQ